MASVSATPAQAAGPRYAVVLKTYLWDSFVERQARRCAALTSGNGDFYISVDETQGTHPSIPFERVVRTSIAELVAMGFPDRAGERTMLWWNPDYAHYQFQQAAPDYDFYIFVEYDAAYSGDFGALVQSLAATQTDIALLPLQEAKESWHWTEAHLATYSISELQGSLLCISAFSSRALTTLAQRRRSMRDDPAVTYWPSAEVFIPTEGRRCGLRFASLEAFGDVAHFNWRPPHPEEWVATLPAPVFVHPVYNRERYVQWALAHGGSLRLLLSSKGTVRRSLSRLPLTGYFPQWTAAVGRCLAASVWQRLISSGAKLRLPAGRST